MRKDTQTTTLYRMVMPDHLGPFRLMSKDLLERQGYSVDDHHLETRKQTDAFKEEHGVETTPQAFIDGERIGGYDELRMGGSSNVPLGFAPLTEKLMMLAMGLRTGDKTLRR